MTDDSFHLAPSPADWEHWITVARRAAAGGYIRDAILGGLRARLFTNNLPLAETWSEIFLGPQDWQKRVHQPPPPDLTLSLFAVDVEKQPTLTAINPAQSTGLMLNRAGDAALVDAVTALAAHKLTDQLGWVVRGTCVAAGRNAVLVIGPGHASVAAEIAQQSGGEITLADPLLVRFTLTRQLDGAHLAPTRILTERGQEIVGARILQWLRRDAYQEPRADVFCLSLDGRDEPVMARDLDLDRRPELYAYPLTRTGPAPSQPPRLTDAITLIDRSLVAVLSVNPKTFVARLAEEQPWTSEPLVREVAQSIECHTAGLVWPPDARLQQFVAEIARRLHEAR